MQHIFPGEVDQWRRRGARVIDVREPAAYAGGHLLGAVNLPLIELSLTPELTVSPLILVCASGVRNARAAAMLEVAGHLEVATLLGGTLGWMQAGRAVEFDETDGAGADWRADFGGHRWP